jgi:hypothetical protein
MGLKITLILPGIPYRIQQLLHLTTMVIDILEVFRMGIKDNFPIK